MNESAMPPKVPVKPEHVCRYFERVPESLIEEPEVCEWCASYSDGYCTRTQ